MQDGGGLYCSTCATPQNALAPSPNPKQLSSRHGKRSRPASAGRPGGSGPDPGRSPLSATCSDASRPRRRCRIRVRACAACRRCARPGPRRAAPSRWRSRLLLLAAEEPDDSRRAALGGERATGSRNERAAPVLTDSERLRLEPPGATIGGGRFSGGRRTRGQESEPSAPRPRP